MAWGMGCALVADRACLATEGEPPLIDALFYVVPCRRYLAVTVEEGDSEADRLLRIRFALAEVDRLATTAYDGATVGLMLGFTGDGRLCVPGYALFDARASGGLRVIASGERLPEELGCVLPAPEALEEMLGCCRASAA